MAGTVTCLHCTRLSYIKIQMHTRLRLSGRRVPATKSFHADRTDRLTETVRRRETVRQREDDLASLANGYLALVEGPPLKDPTAARPITLPPTATPPMTARTAI